MRQTESFSATDPFLTTFYYVEKLNGILHKNRGLRNLIYPYMGIGRVKNCQYHLYIINEWPLISLEILHPALLQDNILFVCLHF